MGGASGGIGGTTASGGITTPSMGGTGGGGGSTNTVMGTGGILPGTGGAATGGMATGGSGAGGIGRGGTTGTVLVATGGIATGGAGVGGITPVGTGGAGGVPSPDAGQADAPAPSCNELTTQGDCYHRADCYSVYRSEKDCACDASGCCTQFDRCAEGRLADCTGPALCNALIPYCEPPYVLSYRSGCYEGCVQQYDCPVPSCPATAPQDGTPCEPVDHKCYYEDCDGNGRTMASCAGSLWKVENGPCAPITCTGEGLTPTAVTCDAGEVCVRTTSTGGVYAITPSCTTQSCGTGPISMACIDVYYSGCLASYSPSGIFVSCTASSSCGSGQGGCQ